ncbi:MAG TPA: hypothetical protein VKU91_05335 [Acidimicrobiales bacterium]|nr:hypothetical protein [Acidimicrobiales bacterium]
MNDPTDEELAAIVAAVEVAWPSRRRPELPATGPPPWRFAGRWWSQPVAVSRQRPWLSEDA